MFDKYIQNSTLLVNPAKVVSLQLDIRSLAKMA